MIKIISIIIAIPIIVVFFIVAIKRGWGDGNPPWMDD